MSRYARCRFIPRRGLVWAALAFCLLPTGCNQTGSANKVILRTGGSDTMVNLAQGWAEEYKKVAPEVEVEVSGGGSGVGIAALAKGVIDLYNGSRDLKPEEIEQARKNTGKEPKKTLVAYDAVAIYVHRSNPLNEISFDQITRIYAEGGTIAKWSELGVKIPGSSSDEIVRVSRQSSSGTYEFLRDHVLNSKDFKLGARELSGSKEIVELVESTPTAIGYGGMGYATPGVKLLKVKKTAGDPAYAPSKATILAQTYPIARSLQVYTVGEPQGAAKAYIQWILSDAGQRVVEARGYVPLPAR